MGYPHCSSMAFKATARCQTASAYCCLSCRPDQQARQDSVVLGEPSAIAYFCHSSSTPQFPPVSHRTGKHLSACYVSQRTHPPVIRPCQARTCATGRHSSISSSDLFGSAAGGSRCESASRRKTCPSTLASKCLPQSARSHRHQTAAPGSTRDRWCSWLHLRLG